MSIFMLLTKFDHKFYETLPNVAPLSNGWKFHVQEIWRNFILEKNRYLWRQKPSTTNSQHLLSQQSQKTSDSYQCSDKLH